MIWVFLIFGLWLVPAILVYMYVAGDDGQIDTPLSPLQWILILPIRPILLLVLILAGLWRWINTPL